MGIFNRKKKKQEQIELRVDEPINCIIDYNKSTDELINYYTEQERLIKNGKSDSMIDFYNGLVKFLESN